MVEDDEVDHVSMVKSAAEYSLLEVLPRIVAVIAKAIRQDTPWTLTEFAAEIDSLNHSMAINVSAEIMDSIATTLRAADAVQAGPTFTIIDGDKPE